MVTPIINSDGTASPSPLVPHTNPVNATQVQGVAWNLFNNMYASSLLHHPRPGTSPPPDLIIELRWTTNYIFWYPFAGVDAANAAKFRFSLDVASD
jgi:hypothetical protein